MKLPVISAREYIAALQKAGFVFDRQDEKEAKTVATQRTYQKTYSWINFKFDFNHISSKAWLQLGQLQSKCDQISGIPLLPSVANIMHRIFLAKGVLATTAIEGNTLTEDEVLRLLDGKLELPPSKEYLAKEIENIIEAMNWITPPILSHAPGASGFGGGG
ncbi:MAG: hypothetical protein ACYDBJ_05640 [Aggregatilineales bacterium]